ncbi:MAG: hypothetical protein GY744_12000 [Gammaproteobacteria bacterium]|nr:hypothetical protein [Gammaproteobacteria bacterium]
MINLLSRFEFKTLLTLTGLVVFILPVYSFIQHGFDPVLVMLPVIALILLFLINNKKNSN